MHFACLGGAEAQLGQCANDTLRKALHLTEQLMVLGWDVDLETPQINHAFMVGINQWKVH